jgi:altronate hydrolase
MKTIPQTIRLHPSDNVVVARLALQVGTTISGENVISTVDIPAGHKIATVAIALEQPIIKYGQIIGFASHAIERGDHVHTHNVSMRDFGRNYAIGAHVRKVACVPESQRAIFKGIVRGDGRVATRNYIGVLATCNCSTTVVRRIADAFGEEVLKDYPNVDGIVGLGHGIGCAMTPGGIGMNILRRALYGYATHPNFAAVLLVGLGCETNQLQEFLEETGLKTGPRLQALKIQDKGAAATVGEGVAFVKSLLAEADRVHRQDVPVSHLVLGVECGGSDAYSGISANPALGVAADLLVAQGGTVALSETTEIYGAEHLLTSRAASREVGEEIVKLIKWWETYTVSLGGEINNNPQPGNKAGGLSTILEKSLGAVAKAGTTNLNAVYQYAEPITRKGLVFMDTPGHDPVSVTGLTAGGVNILCFTTGCGSVFGSKPVPSLKLATNSAMYHRMRDDMDINCGTILDGERTVEEMGQIVFQGLVSVASGKKTKSELFGMGDYEFVPWQIGVVV